MPHGWHRLLFACLYWGFLTAGVLSTVWLVLGYHDWARGPAVASFPDWWAALLSGEWGYSRRTGEDVLSAIAVRTPATLALAFAGISLGAVGALLTRLVFRQRTRGAFTALLGTALTLARGTPVLVLVMALVSVFSYYLNWLPAIVLEIRTERLSDVVSALAMPVATVGVLSWAWFCGLLHPADKPGRVSLPLEHAAWCIGMVLMTDALFALPSRTL